MKFHHPCWFSFLLCFGLSGSLLAQDTPAQMQQVLVPLGAAWKYLDNGSNQGTNWVTLDFNDAGWASGPARLGYGNDGEVTLVSYGPDPNNKYVTTYFRHSFLVTNAAAYTGLRLDLLRDDGAVVYLNGSEIVRDGMPFGTIGYNTYASIVVGDSEEDQLFPFVVPVDRLREGPNVLAVEIHQSTPSSSDIGFNLALTGTLPIPPGSFLIDFDDVESPCPFAATIRLTDAYAHLGVLFEGPGGLDGGAILHECSGFSVTGHSSPNFLAFNLGPTLQDGGVPRGPETIWFVPPVSQVSLSVASYTSGQVTLTAFDAQDVQLDEASVALSTAMTPLQVGGDAIAKVVVSCDASAFVLDNLIASSVSPMANRSFETGDFTDWIVSDVPFPFQPLSVLADGYSVGFGFFTNAATHGDFSAIHGFDGAGPGSIRIAQDVFVPAGRTLLTFDYRAAWDNGGTLPREFNVVVEPNGGGTALFSTNILRALPGTRTNDTGPLTGQVILSAFADTTVRISFDAFLPESSSGPGFFQLDNVDLVSGGAPPRIVTQPRSQTAYLGQTVTLTVVAAGTAPLTYQWDFNGAAIPDGTNSTLTIPGVALEDAGRYRVVVSNPFGSAASDKITLTVTEVPPWPAYVRSTAGEPWNQGVNTNLMDQVFGTNQWDSFYYETVNLAALFAPTRRFVFMEGSDDNASEMEDFLNANRSLLEGWVQNGGVLFLNAAPNEGNGMNFGFGVDLVYSDSTESAEAALPLHPIFLGPFTPVGTEWTGNSFGHATVQGAGLTALIVNQLTGRMVLAERPYGAGYVLFGGMTMPNYHSPQPEATNLRANIFVYADSLFDPATDKPPRILVNPQDQFTLEGMDVALVSVASGSAPLSYQWFQNGTPLAGANSSVLNLNTISTNQAGAYWVVITNNFGAQTSQVAQVTVQVSRGTIGYYFDNSYGSEPNLEYPLVKAGFIPVRIENITTADFNEFDLLLLTESSYAFTSQDLLDRLPDVHNWVLAGGRVIVHDPILLQEDELPMGNPLLIGAPATRLVGQEGFDIDISLPGGAPLASGPYGTLDNNSLDSLTGDYTHGGYALGQTLPIGSRLLLHQNPEIARVVGFSYGLGGGFVYFTTIHLSDILLYQPAIPRDAVRDVYLPNLIDFLHASAPSGPPAIGVSPVSQSVLQGGSARLGVTASGQIPLQYQWYFDGAPLAEGTNAVLALNSVTSAQSGNYQVIVNNLLGSATSAVARLTVFTVGGPTFRVASLTANGAGIVDHYDVTGDNRGGIAAGASRILYSGDSATGSFSLDDLSDGRSIGTIYDSLCANLNSQTLYVFGDGDFPVGPFETATALLEIDEITGNLTGNRINLSSPVPLLQGNVGGGGIFAGFDRILIHNGSHLIHISLPSGQVLDLGSFPVLTHAVTEYWAYWGIAEFYDETLYLVYVQDEQSIVRTRVPDGETTTLTSFMDLGEMPCITASVRLNRWYFQHEGNSQFGGNLQTLGFADATFEVDLPPSPPIIRFQTTNTLALMGSQVTLRVVATGTAPLAYQWSFNGQDILNATNANLVLSNLRLEDAGTYQVAVFNSLGSTNSDPLTLRVVEELTLGEALDAPHLTWRTGGNAPWTAQTSVTSDGEDAAQSGRISHNQETWIETTVQGPTPLSFRWKVSSESCCDYLEFFINGTRQDYMRGEIDWQERQYSLDPGTQTLRWRYRKDGSVNTGQDRGWVDQVTVVSPPIFSELGTKILWEDLPSFPPSVTNIAFTVVDDTTPGSNLVFSVTSTNTAVIPPENIFVSGSGTNFTITVIPLPNAFGNTLILLQATDLDGNVGSVELGISVRSINDPPSFTLATNLLVVADTAGLEVYPDWAENIQPGPPNESDQAVTFLVSNNASNLFTVQPTLNAGGTLTFIAAPGLFGDAIVSVQLQDNGGRGFGGQDTSPVQTFTIRVAAGNQPPLAQSATFEPLEDQPFTGAVIGSDLDGDPLTFHLLNAPALGMVVLNTNTGAFTYTPPANYNGSVNFTFAAHDGKAFSLPGTVTLEIQPVNDVPSFVKGPDVTVQEDAGAQILANWATAIQAGPADESGQSLQFQVGTEQPGLFAVLPAISPTGTLSFTPAADANGTATLQVALQDDGGTANGGVDASPVHTLTVTIEPVNDAPSFVKGPDVTVQEDAGAQTLANWATAIQAGPANESGQTMHFELSHDHSELFAAGPALSSSGGLTFTPAADQHGQAMVRVVLRDSGGTEFGGQDASAEQSFTITIHPVNDPPEAHDQSATTKKDTELALTLSGSDVDGDALTYQIVTQPEHGTLTGSADQADWLYQPAADYSGPDQFRFRVSDGTLESAEAVVSITVEAVNNPPVAVVRLEPVVLLGPGQTNQLVITPYNDWAWVVLDGSQSSDLDGDELEYLWLEEGSLLPFATGAIVTNLFETGRHTVVLLVDDGQEVATASTEFEVVGPGVAVEEIVLLIDQSDMPANRKQPLSASLNPAVASFDRNNLISGIRQLEAFQNKVRAQVAPKDPASAEALQRAVQGIIDAILIQGN